MMGVEHQSEGEYKSESAENSWEKDRKWDVTLGHLVRFVAGKG